MLERTAADASLAAGYTQQDVESVPEGSNMGLGCGNPQAIASLKPGETVLDLGSGAGFDCFLAAKAVGPTGTVAAPTLTATFPEGQGPSGKVYDYRQTPSRVGSITDIFWRRPNAFRSDHPTHSLAAIGREAAANTEFTAWISTRISRTASSRAAARAARSAATPATTGAPASSRCSA